MKPHRRPAPRHEHVQAEAETLFTSIGEGIIATDSDGTITRINPVALAILGYGEDELIGSWFPSAIVATYEDGSPIEMIDRPVTKAIVTGKTVATRASYRRKDGSLVPVSLTVSPILHQRKPIGAIEVFRDITMDIKTDKMKTDFISVASHQLRTPLSAINVYSHMLHDGLAGTLSSEQLIFTQSILTSVERMNDLINTLLNITRIEAGGVNVTIAPTDFGACVREIVEEVEPEAKKKRLQLTKRIDSMVPEVTTDSLLVKEIIANLLSNAIKYTPAGGTVTASLQLQDSTILFSVQDTGFGIPLAAQEHIFSKFFRADNIITEDVSGTGLGLYLTKTIAESLNGEVWFESEERVGSTFYFSLPLKGSSQRAGKFKLES